METPDSAEASLQRHRKSLLVAQANDPSAPLSRTRIHSLRRGQRPTDALQDEDTPGVTAAQSDGGREGRSETVSGVNARLRKERTRTEESGHDVRSTETHKRIDQNSRQSTHTTEWDLRNSPAFRTSPPPPSCLSLSPLLPLPLMSFLTRGAPPPAFPKQLAQI